MADTKKYYWLKLDRNFFKRHDIQIIESQKNGKEYVLFYMKLLLESIDHEGNLRFNEFIPYNDSMLSTITNTDIDVVRNAIKMFEQLEMIEILDDQTIFVRHTEKMLGEGKSTERVRRHREKQKVLLLEGEIQGNVTETLHETEIEKEIDIEKEIKEKPNKKSVYGSFQNVRLSDKEIDSLKEKFPDYQNRIENLSVYIKSKGDKYKDHYATILNWARKEEPKTKPKEQRLPRL